LKARLRPRSPSVVVLARYSSVVREAVVVKVDLSATLLQNANNVVERAETILVDWAAGVGLINWEYGVVARDCCQLRVNQSLSRVHVHDEADLLRGLHGRARKHLHSEVGCKRDSLTSHKCVLVSITSRTQRWALEQGSQVERGKCVEHNNLMRSISIDGLVEREVGSRVVESLVQCGVGARSLVRESSNELVEEALSLSSGNRRTGAVVVVKRQVEVVLVVQEVLLREKVAESRVTEGMGLVRAKLEHGNGIGGREIDTASLRLETGKRRVKSVGGKLGGYGAPDTATGGNVGVIAGLVGGTRVVETLCLNDEFNVDFIQVVGDTRAADLTRRLQIQVEPLTQRNRQQSSRQSSPCGPGTQS
jgi:hypothetical protein